MRYLALQIGQLHYVRVRKPQDADTRGSQIKRDRRTQSSHAHNQGPGRPDSPLTFLANTCEAQMPAISLDLLSC